MVDFVFSRPQPESPEWAMEQQDLMMTPPALGQTFESMAAETTGAIGRYLGESLYEPQGLAARIGRGIAATSEIEGGVPPEQRVFQQDFGAAPLPDPVQRSAAEINEQAGAHITDQPMGSHLADMLISAKQKEIERENIWTRYKNTHAWYTNFAVSTAAFLADPLNAATLFVPPLGEEALLARLGTGLVGRTVAGAGSLALGATAAQLPLTALKYGIGQEERSDYDLRAAFADLAMNAAAGAIFGAGFGALRHVLRGRGIEAPEAAPRAGAPDLTAEATRILDAPATTQNAAISTAVAQMAEGRPVDVEPILRTPEPIEGLKFLPPRLEGPDVIRRTTALAEQAAQPGMPQLLLRGAGQGIENYEVRGPTGESLGINMRVTISGTTARIDDIIGFGAGQLGPRAVRSLLRQFADEHPDITEITGLRTSGARLLEGAGGAEARIPINRSPADFAARQQQLYRDGYAPGVPQAEIDAVRTALAELEARPPTKPALEEKPPEEWGKPQPLSEAAEQAEHPVIPEAEQATQQAQAPDPEIVAAEDLFERSQLGKPPLLPEEQAALDESRAALVKADLTEQALQEAANCLKESGI